MMEVTFSGASSTMFPVSTTRQREGNESFSISAAGTKSITEHPDGGNDIWRQLSQSIDIREATMTELCDVSEKLYSSGQISLLHHALLTFDPSQSPQDIQVSLNVTRADAGGKRDWIAEFEARADLDARLGNDTGYRRNRELVDLLEHLQ